VSRLGGWWHLARRFLEVLLAKPLTDAQRAEVRALLRSDGEAALFFTQPAADQQHGLAAARYAPPTLRRAALLHDVGKQASGMGVWGRSLASVAAKFHIPVRGRLARYLEHGPIGADMLEREGGEPIVVEYARHHHGQRPPGVLLEDWVLLVEADRKARPNNVPPIR
jgi:putative nucleotidyltransferase with HDIG domain